MLAADGVGRLRVLVPTSLSDLSGSHQALAGALAGVVPNLNGSLDVSSDGIDLRRGDPVALLEEPDVVVACVEDAAEEMLLQAACKRLRVPLVLGGLQEERGQATTILPGDPGIALIYQSDTPHLDRSRPGSLQSRKLTGKAVGNWLAEQVVALRVGTGEVLQNRLLYADMSSGEMHTFPLGR
jgi:molybdopterin/thiamine biosynthesis adenylyltransferase